MKKRAVLALLLVLAFLLTACRTEPGKSGNNQPSNEDHCTIGMSFDSFVIERWIRDRDVFVSTANGLGADVNVQSANGDVQTQISQIKYFIKNRVNAIVIVTIDSDALTPVIEEAENAGIPVICYDRIVRNAGCSLYISFNNEAVGMAMGNGICKNISDGANIVKVMGPKTDYNVDQVMNGFDKACESHNLKVLASCNCDEWQPELAYDFVNKNINTVKEAEAIMCGNDALAGEVIHALAERGLSRKIYTVGQDADLEACQRIVEGTQLMTVYKPVERLAKLAAECAVKLAKKQPLENVSKFNDGKHEIPYIAIEPIAVFKDNIDEVIINSGFHQYEEVYMNVNGNKNSK